jgi:phosphoenolpyruvate carboxykinase (ATP)
MMNEAGLFNASFGVDQFGLSGLKSISYNLEAPELYEEAIRRGEAVIARNGPLVAETGVHTGRSPKDKFIVRDAHTDKTIWWDNSSAMTPAQFDALRADMLAHAAGRDLFAQDLRGGAEAANQVSVRVITEYAWHSLFIRNLLIRPSADEVRAFVADLTILD